MLSKEKKKKIFEEYGSRSGDTGSPEVQIALLTARINEITRHLKIHRKDYSSRRGLLMLVGRRSALLKYLARKNRDRYLNLIKRLGLRK